MSAQDKESKEREQLRRNQAYLTELVPCGFCQVPTERQILVHGDCPSCRAHDKQQAKIDEAPRA